MKCRLYSDRGDMINHIISECRKLWKGEYKTRHDWVEELIIWKLSKKLNVDHNTKDCKRKLESIQHNKTHTFLCVFYLVWSAFMAYQPL